MKKLLFILLFAIGSYSSISQTTPCNDSLLMSIKGTWKKYPPYPKEKGITQTEYDQAIKKMEACHQLLLEAYPEAIGCEPVWHSILSGYGSASVPWVYCWDYESSIFEYLCSKNKPEKNGETATYIHVVANQFGNYLIATNITINGQAVFYRQPKAGKWKSYDAFYKEEEPQVLLTRKDMLPYKPVTRKQYLDYEIHWVDSFYTVLINNMKNTPEPQQELITNVINTKNRFIKLHQKELEKSSALNLLDSPAVITQITVHNFDDNTEVFTTEEKGGTVLLMVNPAYFKKELPKYIPQFIIVRIENPNPYSVPLSYFAKTVKEKFSLEKIQEMIDK